ncbi:MAG: segregation and condensation protein A [Brevinematia bacterium]
MQSTKPVQSSSVFVEIDMMVKIDEFEGPLGLLLTLIVKNKLDITRISLVKIVDQYIEYSKIQKPDLKTYAEFIRIASILLYLKTLALSGTKEKDEDMEMETENLIHKLQIIEKFRKLGEELKMKRKERKKMLSKMVKRDIFRARRYSVDDIMRLAVKYFINIQRDKKIQLKRDEGNLTETIEKVKMILRTRHSFSFSEFVTSQSINQIITSFMAILETTKSDLTALKQEKNFDDIFVLRKSLNEGF